MQFREHQFVYGTSIKQPAHMYNAVSKLDVKQGTSKQWYEANCIATEPLMLPRPGATEEVQSDPFQTKTPPGKHPVRERIYQERLPGEAHPHGYQFDSILYNICRVEATAL